jgi:GNAT superfamily N-acetyltransferase
MSITLSTPRPEELPRVIDVLGGWQQDGLPVQLHPGDLGWAYQIGAPALARRIRMWSSHGEAVALGFLDSPTVLRVAMKPVADSDEELAAQMSRDIADSSRGVLPEGDISVEARFGSAFRARLNAEGWQPDEPWTLLTGDFLNPIDTLDVRVEEVGLGHVLTRVAVQNASFGSSRFTEERWHAMAAGPAYAGARCLLAYDHDGTAVAIATVWSAGVGRPGLIEPMGVHPEHRGLGYGTAITKAAASALHEMGSSSALVCAESSNAGAVSTYAAAGFRVTGQVTDFRRGFADER